MQERLDDRVEKYEQAMGLIREFFSHDPLPEPKRWRQMLDRLKLATNYRALVQAGYAPCVIQQQGSQKSPELSRAAGADLIPTGQLAPGNSFMPVLYYHGQRPLSSNDIGFDLNTPGLEPKIRNARDRNALSATRLTPLVFPHSGEVKEGIFLFLPVYEANVPVDSVSENEPAVEKFQRLSQQRMSHHQGTVFGVLEMDLLLEDLLEDAQMEVAFEIFDGHKIAESRRVHDRCGLPTGEDRVRCLDITNRIALWPMYGDRWSIAFYPTALFEKNSPRRITWMVFTAGMVTTFCFMGVAWMQTRQRMATENHAREMKEARDVIHSLSQEQDRIRRDLHDGVLQSLYALGLGIQKTRRAIARNSAEAEELSCQNLEALELSMGELRRHLGDSETPKDLDLEPALKNLSDFMHRQGRIPVQFVHHGEGPQMDSPEALQLLQIAREAIINAQRHSNASLVQILLRHRGDGVEMTISDNGSGFDSSLPRARGFGLKNMADRARNMGGVFNLTSAPGRGTCVSVQIVSKPRRESAGQPRTMPEPLPQHDPTG